MTMMTTITVFKTDGFRHERKWAKV